MFSLQKDIFKRINHTDDITIRGLIFAAMFNPNFKAMLMIEKMRRTKNTTMKLLRSLKIQKYCGCVITSTATIGENLLLPHPLGVVIGASAVVGKDCTIFQQVTLGQKDGKYPVIGNNVTIYPGAKIFGDIKIGDNVIIGANSVVNTDIPDNAVAAGIAARVLRTRG